MTLAALSIDKHSSVVMLSQVVDDGGITVLPMLGVLWIRFSGLCSIVFTV